MTLSHYSATRAEIYPFFDQLPSPSQHYQRILFRKRIDLRCLRLTQQHAIYQLHLYVCRVLLFDSCRGEAYSCVRSTERERGREHRVDLPRRYTARKLGGGRAVTYSRGRMGSYRVLDLGYFGGYSSFHY